jgi:hypothetical protein
VLLPSGFIAEQGGEHTTKYGSSDSSRKPGENRDEGSGDFSAIEIVVDAESSGDYISRDYDREDSEPSPGTNWFPYAENHGESEDHEGGQKRIANEDMDVSGSKGENNRDDVDEHNVQYL